METPPAAATLRANVVSRCWCDDRFTVSPSSFADKGQRKSVITGRGTGKTRRNDVSAGLGDPRRRQLRFHNLEGWRKRRTILWKAPSLTIREPRVVVLRSVEFPLEFTPRRRRENGGGNGRGEYTLRRIHFNAAARGRRAENTTSPRWSPSTREYEA